LVLIAVTPATAVETGANPIRKIVTLMQNMQKEIEAEGVKEKELFDKFMCFCSANTGDLGKAEADAKAKAEEMTAKLKSEEAEKSQLEQELVDHKSDRETAKADLAEATTLREKEAAEFSAMKADSETNIASLSSAIPAIEKGMGASSLLQMPAGRKLQKLVESYTNMDPMDRRQITAFLQGGDEDMSGGSGEILGILKQMKEEMEGNLAGAEKDEAAAVEGFASLKSSKETEIEVATEAIETKTSRSGELAVSVVQTKDALEDATEEIANAGKYAEQLAAQCAEKEKEFGVRQKMRAEEIAAIGEAIGILNDDDALDIFKKTASFAQAPVALLQRSTHKASRAKTAQAMLARIASKDNSVQVKLMLYTLNSKLKVKSKGGMDEVIKMIDDMVVLLGKQQKEDDTSVEFCKEEFDKAEDEEKAAKTKLGQLDATLSEETDAISSLMEEISVLKKGIEELDYAVAQATMQRKEEHAEYIEEVQMNEAAIGLVGKAKAKLEKFYAPKAAASAAAASSASFVQEAQPFSFVQIKAHSDSEALFDVAPPPPPPDMPSGEYKKSGKSAGVMGMMDDIVRDLEMDVKDAEYEEKTAAKDYGELMSDSQATRAANSKAIVDKTATKAETEGKLMQTKEARAGSAEDVKLAATTITDLHASCDFIMQNYDMRKEARSNEIDSLKNAKAVLSGAKM
jgi:hypothetical protein